MNTLRRHLVAASLALAVYASLPATVGAATLTISGCDNLTVVSATEVSCSAAPASPGAPSVCTASPSPTNLPATGGTVNLGGSCTGGAAVASTTWTRSGTPVSSPDTLPSNGQGTSPEPYTYTARFCAADGTSCTNAARTVTVAAGAAPPPGPGSCGNLAVIEPQALNGSQKNLTWDSARYVSSGFSSGTTNVLVARIDVPQNSVLGTSSLAVFEWASPKTQRRVWLSKNRCDFSPNGFPYNPLPANGPRIYIKVGGANDPNMVWMQPGDTWYMMVKNEKILSGVVSSSCSGSCDVAIELSAPR